MSPKSKVSRLKWTVAFLLSYVCYAGLLLLTKQDEGAEITSWIEWTLVMTPMVPLLLIGVIFVLRFKSLDEFFKTQVLEASSITLLIIGLGSVVYSRLEAFGFPLIPGIFFWNVAVSIWIISYLVLSWAKR